MNMGDVGQTQPLDTGTGQAPAADPAAPLESVFHHQVKREIIDFVKLIAWFLVLFFVIKTYVIESCDVQGRSMLPTLHDNEKIMVLKLPLVLSRFHLFSGIDALHEGDIVVFESPVEPDKRYVKRLIARGPDVETAGNSVAARQTNVVSESTVSVLYDRGAVYVNNRRLDERYLDYDRDEDEDSLPEVRLMPGSSYVLGDNRNESKDSRSFGPITNDRIVGKALLCFWPPSKIRLLQ